MRFLLQSPPLAAVLSLILSQAAYALENPAVTRLDAGHVTVAWSNSGPVDIYIADSPSVRLRNARRVATRVLDGTLSVAADASQRRYFLLKDRRDGSVTRVAERLVPLQQGSNFRDLGGYPAAGGKHVRWGRIYRSGATPMLTDADYALVSRLDIAAIVDFRSLDERELAPTFVDDRTGALYISNDYRTKALFAAMDYVPGKTRPVDPYNAFPDFFLPQYRAVFGRLLANEGAVLYNCSAGQDRTGTATALILTALGVPRDVILKDYHLSTELRRPDFEMPAVTASDHPDNPVAQLYARMDKAGARKAEALYAPDGQSFLEKFFVDIESRWGSVDAYLTERVGLTPDKVALLRRIYLE